MDKRLHVTDVILIAKTSLPDHESVVKFKVALLEGLRKQEVEKVGYRIDALHRELDDLIQLADATHGTPSAYGGPTNNAIPIAPRPRPDWKSKPAQ